MGGAHSRSAAGADSLLLNCALSRKTLRHALVMSFAVCMVAFVVELLLVP